MTVFYNGWHRSVQHVVFSRLCYKCRRRRLQWMKMLHLNRDVRFFFTPTSAGNHPPNTCRNNIILQTFYFGTLSYICTTAIRHFHPYLLNRRKTIGRVFLSYLFHNCAPCEFSSLLLHLFAACFSRYLQLLRIQVNTRKRPSDKPSWI